MTLFQVVNCYETKQRACESDILFFRVYCTTVQFAAAYNYSISPYLDTMRLVNDKDSPFPGFQFLAAPGHSPGHMTMEISSEGETLRVTGDTWGSRVSSVHVLQGSHKPIS